MGVGVDELTSRCSCLVGHWIILVLWTGAVVSLIALWCDALWCIDRTGVVGDVLLLPCKYSLQALTGGVSACVWHDYDGSQSGVARSPCVCLGVCASAHSCTLLYQAFAGSANGAPCMHALMHAAGACWVHGCVQGCWDAGRGRDSLSLMHTTPGQPSAWSVMHACLTVGLGLSCGSTCPLHPSHGCSSRSEHRSGGRAACATLSGGALQSAARALTS